MSLATIRGILRRQQASIRLVDGELVLRGPRGALNNRELKELISAVRSELLDVLRAGESFDYEGVGDETPPNLISPDAKITPDRIPLLRLTQDEIDSIISTIPGGAAQIKDIYPLTPLQEGMLFHYLMVPKGDPYLLYSLVSFTDRETLDAYIAAYNAVVSRHDILRTVIRWEGLREPVQVVLRHAELRVEEIEVDEAAPYDAVEQLKRRFDPGHHRIDIREAPLVQIYIARDARNARWVAMELQHHLATDRSSHEIIDAEISAILEGRADNLPEPVPYRNFVAHVRSTASRSEHEAFFKELLGDVESTTAPFGLLDVHRDGSKINEVSLPLSESISARLLAEARSNGVGAASIFHVALGHVLGRICTVDKPVFGTVLFGRMRLGGANKLAAGPSINTLPVLIDSKQPVLECVKRTHNLLATLLHHEHAPLALTQNCARLAPGVPLFTSVLNFRHSLSAEQPPVEHTSETAHKIESIGGREGNNYPLTLSVDGVGAAFTISLQAAEGIDAQQVLSLIRTSVTNIVDAMKRTPSRALCELDILTMEEESELVRRSKGDTFSLSENVCIHHLFEEQVQISPDSVAVRASGEHVTYRELHERSNQLAHLLLSSGASRGAIVGLCMRRSIEQVVTLLAILKSGSAVLPLDPDYPKARLSYLLEDSGCRVVVTTSAHSGAIAGSDARRVVLDQQQWTELPVTSPAVAVMPDDIAYVLYTSGSTGNPKGVVGLHRALTSRLLPERGKRDGSEIYAQKTSINFIDSFWEVFLPLTTGAVIEVVPTAVLENPSDFCRLLNESEISHLVLVPTLLSALISHLEATNGSLPALRYCVSSGEALSAELANRFKAYAARAQLVNIYGTTEFWDATSHLVTSEESDSVPIGFPMPNVGTYVLDERMRPVPPGVEGELYVTSQGIGPGYWRNESQTAKAFVPSPFEPGTTMYRTGDRVRWDAQTGLTYVGRVDQQINLRGFRVEPGEIEHALARLPGVAEAAVVTRGSGDDARLAAYVVPSKPSGDAERVGFGVFYFSDSKVSTNDDNLRVYIESVRRADELGFDAVWTPERHFTEVGAAFPNPSVLSAAAAMVTQRIQLRSGSVVLPLHNPVRVAEEWSVVDRLSGGRVALSFASGWVPDDFVLAPDNFERRHDVMLEAIEKVRTLWRGGTVAMRNGIGRTVEIATQPRPIQTELPVWVTAAGTLKTFTDAGRLGANVLTHVLNTTVAGLGEKIAAYRRARKQAGFDPFAGKVAVMLHSYVLDDASAAIAEARPHLEQYFRSQLKLRKDVGEALGLEVDTDKHLSDEVISLAASRYLATKALIGSPESCAALVQELHDIGADEIACLIDFGLPSARIMAGLASLDRLRRSSVRRLRPAALRDGLAASLPQYMVPDDIIVLEHLPLTPSGKVDRRALPEPTAAQQQHRIYVAPRNDLEARLAGIWAEVLRLEKVGITDGFFDLGGNSIAAIRIINRAQQALGLRLSLRELFDKQTIAALEVHSVTAAPVVPRSSSVLKLSSRDGNEPLFCVHGGTGNASFYSKLAEYVGRDTPLYGFQYPGLLPEGSAYASVSELASDYLAQLRQLQPNGPYRLLGWSFGGLVAFEMARQLQAMGQSVSFLGLVDAPIASGAPPVEKWSDGEALQYLLRVYGAPESPEDASNLCFKRGLDRLKTRQLVPESFGPDDLLRSVVVVRDIVHMRMQYRPGEYAGDIHYVAAGGQEADVDDAIARWRAIVKGGITVKTVAATHDRMFDDAHIEEVGGAVRELLSHSASRVSLASQ